MTMRYRVQSAGGVASRVKVGGHELLFDQQPKFGGEDRGPSPLEVLVAATGACAHYYAAAYLSARKLPVEGLEVEIEADKAPDRPARLASARVVVKLPPGIPEEHLPRLDAAVRTCPAYGTLVSAVAVDLAIERQQAAA